MDPVAVDVKVEGIVSPAALGGSGSEFGSDSGTDDGDEPLELIPSDSSDRLLGGEGPRNRRKRV